MRTALVTGLFTFSLATYLLHSDAADRAAIEPLLARLGIPGQHQGVPLALAVDGALVQTQFSGCTTFFPNSKPPVVPAAPKLRELCFSSFAILHSGQTKTPVFVAQRLNSGMLVQAQGIGRTDKFYAEARLPAAERAELPDYRGSGYARGHLAPAGDMHTLEAMAQSFSLANIVPQDARHNSGAWNKIEQDTRRYVMRARGDVYIITGAVYGAGQAEAFGKGQVAVPTHLYKLVYDAHTRRSWAHWQANHADAKPGPPITYEEVGRRINMQFLM